MKKLATQFAVMAALGIARWDSEPTKEPREKTAEDYLTLSRADARRLRRSIAREEKRRKSMEGQKQ